MLGMLDKRFGEQLNFMRQLCLAWTNLNVELHHDAIHARLPVLEFASSFSYRFPQT